MAAVTTIAELRRMHVEDLHKEIRDQRHLVAQLHLAVKMQKDKDSAKYRRERRQLARMETVRSEKTGETKSAQKIQRAHSPQSSGVSQVANT